MGDGRITGKTSVAAQAAALLRRGRQATKEYREKKVVRQNVLRKADKALTEEQVKARLALTDVDFAVLDEIIQSPKRNAMAQLAALRMKALFTVTQPKQEVSADVGIRVIVNTLRRPEVVEVVKELTDGDGEVVEELGTGSGGRGE